MKRYYRLEDEEKEETSGEEQSQSEESEAELSENELRQSETDGTDSEEQSEDEVKIKGYNLARGEGLVESSDEEFDETALNSEDEKEEEIAIGPNADVIHLPLFY